MVGNSDGTKGTRCVPISLIAVHEEAGDEGAHAQLIVDRFRLRYRDTSLSMSSEMTRTLPKTESWVAAWLEFFFRSTLSFFSTSGTKGRTACSARNGTDARDGLVAVAKTSWRKNKISGDAELRQFRAKGFPFMAAAGLQLSFNHPGTWCRQHETRQWSAREISAA
jgi:hypothetical protein